MKKKQKKMLIRILTAAALLVLLQFIHPGQTAAFIFYMATYLIVGYDILIKAFKGIVNGQVFDENFLMAIASVGAIVLAFIEKSGDYNEAVAVMLFYQVGEWFQGYAVGKSRRHISALMDIRPDYANIEQEGKLVKVDPDEVPTGSLIVVQPGEKVPIDGIIREGHSALDTAALTGESVPRQAGAGDEVLSGCINMSGVLKIETTCEFGESTASKILDLVENAGSLKSKPEDFITRFARVYTPLVCAAALILALVPPLVSGFVLHGAMNWTQWIYRALTFLVISCPCALVISIPLSFFGGIGGASREGILIKGSRYLEGLARTRVVVFDKTGTLTEGSFEVTGIHHNRRDPDKLLEMAALAESASSHPISQSIRASYGKAIDRSRVSEIEEISGYGVTAKVDGKFVAAGNHRLMEKLGIDCQSCTGSGTIIYLAVDGQYEGHLVISDKLKVHAGEAVEALKKAGVSKTVMLTGDLKKTADEVAGALGIDEVHSELLPADKVRMVEKLLKEKDEKETLAFAGDGINDAPVLSRADIGIAMGAMGSDAAIEAADIVLMDDDPLKIAKAIRIARKCLRIVYENIWFSILIKLLFLILGAFGIANMGMAIFADVGVMILAVLNAIRALMVKKV